MGLYNFQQRFAPFVLSGAKTHTIRAKREHADKPGNTLHLYTGLRTKNTQLLMRVPCTKVEDIMITTSEQVIIEGIELDESEREALAKRDGFESFAEMATFWKGRLPFSGDVIHWRNADAK